MNDVRLNEIPILYQCLHTYCARYVCLSTLCLFARLCGYEPFYDPHEVQMLKKIMKCDYEFHEDFWSDISHNAKVCLLLEMFFFVKLLQMLPQLF